ncbi:MAG: PAS domain S-box protein [Candidatus Eisenbacteria bacterium]|nr:PAS domain S-box protein [Candidatus Eisenbacteria bacterium]
MPDNDKEERVSAPALRDREDRFEAVETESAEETVSLILPGAPDDPFGDSLGVFSRSVDALQSSCSLLERRCAELNWALEESNRKLKESLEERGRLASRLDGILRCLSVGVVAIDPSGRVIEYNAAAERITGYPREKVIGADYREALGRGFAERLGLLHTMKSGVAVDGGERTMVTASGEEIPVAFGASLVRAQDGSVVGAVEAFTDLRKAKRMEEELLRSRTLAAVGEVAAETARQVRNPLAGLSGFADILARDLAADPDRMPLVRKIQQGVSGVERAVERLLESTRETPVRFDPVDLISLIEGELDRFETGIGDDARIVVVRRLSRDGAPVRVDAPRIARAFRALFVNAYEAMPGGGVLTVTAGAESARPGGAQRVPGERDEESPASFIRVAVADTGAGMTAEEAEKAFSPFYSTKPKRMGLGLTTARRIVTGHGGEVDLTSSPDSGTRVTVRLPVIRGVAGARRAKS